ncbi:hypothetical protein FQN50_007360 [Emmonsiellopsis sp. PD_5]|nr:hypothetical protein FQN50_007360 [Emmonsiellopsis sp. PD_5]
MNQLSSASGSMPPLLALLLACVLPLVSAQWSYPPNLPSHRNIADYTSGKVAPIKDYHIYDILIGGFNTSVPSFEITRCAKEGRTEPIYPSNSTFNSTDPHIAADGTWEYMDGYSDTYPNVYHTGKQPYISPFHYLVDNATMGRNVCWWELYRVEEEYCCEGPSRMSVKLMGGDRENYFATVPFIVNPRMRADGRNYTWNKGDHTSERTTFIISNQNAAGGLRSMLGSGVVYVLILFLGLVHGVLV